ncbi:MAG: response regulator transcription factor [Alcanivoracaceae bacterium]|nr:response regulator transcription factor [Alcanivoracaceae bacterium]
MKKNVIKISAIIVEDSRLARIELQELLKSHPQIEIIAEAENVDKATQLIKQHNPTLIFLDINMPGKNGFDLSESLDQLPIVVFTTAYDEYAIKAFEHNAFDYLLKPISQSRFSKTMDKLLPHLMVKQSDSNEKSLTEKSQVFIKEGEQCWMMSLGQITLFEIMGNYTTVYFDNKQPLIYKSLNQIEKSLPDKLFFRANRQQIINIKHINNVEVWFKGTLKITLKNNIQVEISRRQSIKFRQMLEL